MGENPCTGVVYRYHVQVSCTGVMYRTPVHPATNPKATEYTPLEKRDQEALQKKAELEAKM